MSSKAHKKKRNTGLLYEFLVQVISSSLVEGDQKSSSKALKILKKHFRNRPDNELYKEFRLIHALRKTTVSSDAVASSILQEAKLAVRSHDGMKLDRQKSLLIKDINHTLNSDDFYDQQVNEYRFLATIQTLFNDWKNPSADLHRIAMYEDQVVKYLTSEKQKLAEHVVADDNTGSNRLLMKVMMRKLNEKYEGVLTNEQKSLVKAYAWSAANDDPDSIKKKLEEIKQSLLESIDGYENAESPNEFLRNKLVDVKEKLVNESFDSINDDTVTRFMLYTKLTEELAPEEKKNV